jgi:hypothetical protein
MMWFILGNWLLSKLKFEPTVHVFGEKKHTARRHRSRLVPDLDEDTSSEETSDIDEEEDDRT